MRHTVVLACLALALLGCASSTTRSIGPEDVPVASPTDLSRAPSTDGALLSSGVSVALDAGTPPSDAGTFALQGRWRVVDWVHTAPDGGVLHLTDNDSMVTRPGSGATYALRVNGFLTLRPTSMHFSFGTQINGHFYAVNPASSPGSPPDAFSATGISTVGILDELSGTFTPAVGSVVFAFVRRPDGRITLRTSRLDGVSLTTFASVSTDSPPIPTLHLFALAQLVPGVTSRPFAHPRVSIFWDHPGASPILESSTSPIVFVSGSAVFPVVQSIAPPRGSVGSVGGVSVAVGYPLVYDDVNANGQWDGPPDLARALGPMAVVFRGNEPPTDAYALSPFADCAPGYTLALLQSDAPSAVSTFLPWDTTHGVAPDVSVAAMTLTQGVPHLVGPP